MKLIIDWVALIAVIHVLYMADLKHMAASRYNLFLVMLLGMITGLILILKRTSRKERDE